MTSLELKLTLPDRLVREAQAAGLLTSTSVSKLLREAIRRRAGLALVAGAANAANAGRGAMSLSSIQAGVKAVRVARRKTA
jgi:hypothetical protein